jgi:GNAT superfamily N-acetyltransferase
VAEAVDTEVLKTCIRMYTSYFSPELQCVFPLVVYRQAALGVDFGSTRTWCMFDRDRRPVGAVSWRIRRPPTAELCKSVGIPSAVAPVAEVLFIAVWEKARSVQYGSDLVEAIAQNALAQGVQLLYVEIGEEQPKAIEFWCKKNGFEKLDRAAPEAVGVSPAQLRFIDATCFRFTDTDQYVKLLL